MRCGSNGGQALTAFECKERTCEDDETDCGDHSVCSNKNNDDGYECSCADGFSGDSVMNQPAVCLPDSCDTFFTVSHGSHGCLNLPSGAECSVSCDEGYTVSGGNVTCYAGSFTNIPTCEPNPCRCSSAKRENFNHITQISLYSLTSSRTLYHLPSNTIRVLLTIII